MYIKHGDHLTKLHALWRNIRYRCKSPTSKDYKRYGGRGIVVCQEWEDYLTFKEWALSVGYGEGLTIERKDNNLGYNPKNCVFLSTEENNKNRGDTKWWYVNGLKFKSSYDAARYFDVGVSTILRWCQGDRQGKYYYPPKPNCRSERKYANHY